MAYSSLEPDQHGKCACDLQIVMFRSVVSRATWVALSVTRPTSAQVMISRFVSSSPESGSVLTAQSLEPASDSVSPSLALSFSLSKINKKNFF